MNIRLSTGAKIGVYIFLGIMVFITVVPLLYVASASFKPNLEILAGGVNLIPKEPTFDNYKEVWGMQSVSMASKATFLDYTVNSIWISALTVVILVTLTSMSSYCFQRGNFPGRKLLYMTFLTTMFIGAGTVTMVPIMQMTSKAGLNNGMGLAIVQGATSGAANLFLTMGYLKTISKDLDDAAKIDGCSFFSIWWRIILPLSKPIVIYTVLMGFMAPWGDFMLASYLIHENSAGMSVAVGMFEWLSRTMVNQNYTMFCAAGVIVAIPVVTVFLLLQKYYVEGVTGGAVKG